MLLLNLVTTATPLHSVKNQDGCLNSKRENQTKSTSFELLSSVVVFQEGEERDDDLLSGERTN